MSRLDPKHRHLVVVDGVDGGAYQNAEQILGQLIEEELRAVATNPDDDEAIAKGLRFVAKRLTDADGDVYASVLETRHGVPCPPHVQDVLVDVLVMRAEALERSDDVPPPDGSDPWLGLTA